MKRIKAYEATDGSIHKSHADAAGATLAHLARTENGDQRGTSLDGPSIAFIIKHRSKVASILMQIDAPEAVGP